MTKTQLAVGYAGFFAAMITACVARPVPESPQVPAASASPSASSTASSTTVSGTPSSSPPAAYLFVPTPVAAPTLAPSDVQDLLTLEEEAGCRIPCWGNVTPGTSGVDDLATLIGAFGVTPNERLTGFDKPILPDVSQLRYLGWVMGGEETSMPEEAATNLGLDTITFYWNAATGTIVGSWLSFVVPPDELDTKLILSKLGSPDEILIAEGATEAGPAYRTVMVFGLRGTVAAIDLHAPSWPLLCMGNDDIGNIELFFVAPGLEPLAFANHVANDLLGPYAHDQSYFTGMDKDEFVSSVRSSTGCVTLLDK